MSNPVIEYLVEERDSEEEVPLAVTVSVSENYEEFKDWAEERYTIDNELPFSILNMVGLTYGELETVYEREEVKAVNFEGSFTMGGEDYVDPLEVLGISDEELEEIMPEEF